MYKYMFVCVLKGKRSTLGRAGGKYQRKERLVKCTLERKQVTDERK